MWGTTTLERNICSQYYERRLADRRKRTKEVLPIAKAPFNDPDPLEYIKNLTVAEFMGFNMYVRMYDDLMKGHEDNPTIGVFLCTNTDSTIAKYSVLNGSTRLFASKHMTCMPTEEELRQEIERQKQFFLDHHKSE